VGRAICAAHTLLAPIVRFVASKLVVAHVPPDVIPERFEARRTSGVVAPAEASDADLLQAIGHGSEPAFEELRHRYRRAVERACRSIVGSELEDCAQEVFVRIWRKAPLYDRRRGSAAAWLLTLARRTALNFCQARRAPVPIEFKEEAGSAEAPDVDRFWLDAALERLPDRERLVIELAYFDDLSQSAIASALGAPLGSVKSWTRRGLNRLATLLDEESQ
jgi:RNA polymerase sigma-70 factor (ECF subfamily)